MSASIYPVDHGMPIPVQYACRRKYNFRNLKVGDSFRVECMPEELVRLRNSLTSCKRWASRKTGYRFVMRATFTGGAAGIRVWRVE